MKKKDDIEDNSNNYMNTLSKKNHRNNSHEIEDNSKNYIYAVSVKKSNENNDENKEFK